MNLLIRAERKEDHAAVKAVIREAFGQPDEADLVHRLRKRKDFLPDLSLVAVEDQRVVGHILFSRIAIVADDGFEWPSLALAPVCVHPDRQRKGIGGRLIREGLKRAREAGHPSVILVGHADYYPRFGFRPAATWKIEAPFDVPADAFMAMELYPHALKGVHGTVRYPEEFNEVA